MTIDEAIAHAREVAEENRNHSNWKLADSFQSNCIQCAEEHEQLAEWLEELKTLRTTKETMFYNVCQILFDGEDTNMGRKVTIDRIKEFVKYNRWLELENGE